jgi:uncharacterized protein YegP (UPF0339 family)
MISRRITAYREVKIKAGTSALPFYVGVLLLRIFIMSAKFEITKSKSGQYRFNLMASNGKVILTGEVFTTKIDVFRQIESIKKHSANNANFQRMISGNEASCFVIKDALGDIIGKSKMYSSIAGMEKGIASVKANAPCARVYDWVVENNRSHCRRSG